MAEAATEVAPARIGRPPTLTIALAERIGEHLLAGNHPATAARAVGVPERTFERWLQKGRADDDDEIDSIFAAFWRVLDQKIAEGECALISDAGRGRLGWQGPMTVASRRFRERWEDKSTVGTGLTIQVGAGADVNIALIASPLSPLSIAAQGESERNP